MYLLLNIYYGNHDMDETRVLRTIGGLTTKKEVKDAHKKMLEARKESLEWLNNQYVLAGYEKIDDLVKDGKIVIKEPLRDILRLEVLDEGIVKANWFGKRYTWTIYCDKDNEFVKE
jgi:hypothetical protein